MWILYTILIIFIVVFIGYALYVFLESKLEVSSSPREPMYECEKHGIFRKDHTIKFLENEDGTPMEWCPFCFDEKIHGKLDESVIPQ